MFNIKNLTLKNIGPYLNQTFDFTVNKANPNIHIFLGSNGTGKTTILHSLASVFDYFENDHKEHTSNKIAKRFHFFKEDNKEMAESYAHSVVTENSLIVDKLINYGCKNCSNIHQNFDKTISQTLGIAKTGKGYKTSPNSKDLLYYKSSISAKDLSNKKFKFAAFAYSGYRFIESEKIEISNNENYNPLHLALEFNKKDKESEKDFQLSSWIVSRYSKAAIEETLGNKEQAVKFRVALNKLIDSINKLTNNEYTIGISTNPWNVGIKHCGKDLEFDVLPDGLRSILSWLGDLLMRLDAIPWENNSIPITEQNIILFLDEIEVHLHPTWQYKILTLLNELLPNAQIFISTHSPFIVNSIDNAKIYLLENNNCIAEMKTEPILSQTGWSISYVLENLMNAKNRFGFETTVDLEKFNQIDLEIVNGNLKNEAIFIELIKKLANDSEEVLSLIAPKIFRLNKITGKNYLNGENN